MESALEQSQKATENTEKLRGLKRYRYAAQLRQQFLKAETRLTEAIQDEGPSQSLLAQYCRDIRRLRDVEPVCAVRSDLALALERSKFVIVCLGPAAGRPSWGGGALRRVEGTCRGCTAEQCPGLRGGSGGRRGAGGRGRLPVWARGVGVGGGGRVGADGASGAVGKPVGESETVGSGY